MRSSQEMGQTDSIGRAPAPRIALRMPSGAYAGGQYVEAAFRVEDDAYALIVAVDRDLRVHVIYPESPTDAGFVQRSQEFRTERIFAGFGQPWAGDTRLRFLRGGVVLAVASARPLQYERLTDSGGDWDEVAIAELLDRGGTSNATSALARKITLTGQTYSTDFSSFSGSRFESLANAFDSYGGYRASCSSSAYYGAGYGYAGGRDQYFSNYGFSGFGPIVQYVQRGNQLYQSLQFTGRCGEPIFTQFIPIPSAIQPLPGTPRDTTKHDSTMTAASSYRQALSSGVAGVPVRGANGAVEGAGDATTSNAAKQRELGVRRRLTENGELQVIGGLRFRASESEPRTQSNVRTQFRNRDASGVDPQGWPHSRRDDGSTRNSRTRDRTDGTAGQQSPRQAAQRSETPERAEPRTSVERQEPRHEAPRHEPAPHSEPVRAATPVQPSH